MILPHAPAAFASFHLPRVQEHAPKCTGRKTKRSKRNIGTYHFSFSAAESGSCLLFDEGREWEDILAGPKRNKETSLCAAVVMFNGMIKLHLPMLSPTNPESAVNITHKTVQGLITIKRPFCNPASKYVDCSKTTLETCHPPPPTPNQVYETPEFRLSGAGRVSGVTCGGCGGSGQPA